MEKFYLGISLGFNSSACVYSSERGLLAAVSQERLNGEKNTKELPFDAMLKCIELANTHRIDKIAISHYEEISNEYFERYGEKYKLAVSNWKLTIVNYLLSHDVNVIDYDIVRVAHHTAHALSSFGFYGIPERNFYTITSDGFGETGIRRCNLGWTI